MCNYYEGIDIGKPIKKYDIYYVDLGSVEDSKDDIAKDRPCIIMSSDDFNCVSNRYTIIPIRTTIHGTGADSVEKAEEIVANSHKEGITLVPIKMEEKLYRFADISQIRSVDFKLISNYHSTLSNPEVRRRLDVEIENYLIRKVTYEKQDCGYNKPTDIGTIIKKFDIWQVYNGAKNSKYVVINNSSGATIMIAPFYTESPKVITDENVSEYINDMRKNGEICVPFKFSSITEYSFINLSKLRYINASQLRKLECSIVSDSVRKTINNKLMELFFNNDEGFLPQIIVEDKVETSPIDITETMVPVKKVEEKSTHVVKKHIQVFKPVESTEKEKSPDFPNEWEMIYNEYNSGKWKAKEAAELLDIKEWKFHELVKKYRNILKEQGIAFETKQVGRGAKKGDIKPYPPGFEMYYKMLKAGTITKSEVCNKLHISRVVLNDLIEQCDGVRYVK